MERFVISKDIEVVYLKALHFPMDVPATFEKLNSLLAHNANRKFYGISHPDNTGVIQYKAAAELLPDETIENSELKKFTIEKGDFVATYIVNHFKDSTSIGKAFEALLRHPQLAPNGYCLEVYKNYTDVDVHCMVRISA